MPFACSAALSTPLGGGGGRNSAAAGSSQSRLRAGSLGAPVRLVTDPPPRSRDLSAPRLLAAQGGACAGCGRPAQGQPPVRACAYTRRAYCAACHRNDAEVLPGGVLHAWDFRKRRVCVQVRHGDHRLLTGGLYHM